MTNKQIVVDEAHHATSSSYRKVLEWYKRNPDLRVLGVTATPDRADEEKRHRRLNKRPRR